MSKHSRNIYRSHTIHFCGPLAMIPHYAKLYSILRCLVKMHCNEYPLVSVFIWRPKKGGCSNPYYTTKIGCITSLNTWEGTRDANGLQCWDGTTETACPANETCDKPSKGLGYCRPGCQQETTENINGATITWGPAPTGRWWMVDCEDKNFKDRQMKWD